MPSEESLIRTAILTVDLDIMEANIRRLQAYCGRHGLANRPHIKTHKIPAIAHEEHGFVDVNLCSNRPKAGERVTVIPNHACGTVNLHDSLYGLCGDTVEVIWRVEARGKIQ